MHISFVKIKNYRGIKSGNFESSDFVCAIGENNAGKSTILLAISLFFSGTTISNSDFYDETEPVEIELTFSNISEHDINRLSEEHRERIKELIVDGKLTLTRTYPVEGKSALQCSRMVPKDGRFDKLVIDSLLKGKKAKEIGDILSSTFHEHADVLKDFTKIGEAKAKLDEIVAGFPAEQLELKLATLPTGIDNSIKTFLPEPIYIAAVKDLKDDVKSKESTTFGKLLGILLRFIESSTHFTDINKSFNELHALLNVVRETDKLSDGRIEKLQAIESQIGSFLQENFPKSKVEIEIPRPELKQVFSNARILIDDGVRDIIETKGDGIKRAVTFALLRTYVEQLKIQRKDAALLKTEPQPDEGTTVAEVAEQPYIFLFEEPELYLHPNAQKILFEALENLSKDGNQVFVTTHSPAFFSPQATGTFIKVKKNHPEGQKPYGAFLVINLSANVELKDAFQILCYENNTAAFFSNKVLLVEGDSDLIFVKEVARLLNPEWNFDNKNIPIISINGKSNVKRFRDFYKIFEIEVCALVDTDAFVDGFEKFEVTDEIKDLRSAIFKCIDSHAEKTNVTADLTASKIKELVRRYSWKERYDRLRVICKKVSVENTITAEELNEIDYLFHEEINNVRRRVLADPTFDAKEFIAFLAVLWKEKVFILSKGAIEDYYPIGITGADKPTKALNAVAFLKGCACINDHLPTIMYEGTERCELELIFEKIFA